MVSSLPLVWWTFISADFEFFLSPSAGGPSLPHRRATFCGHPTSDTGGPAAAQPEHQQWGEAAVGLTRRQLEHPQVPQHPRDWLYWDRERKSRLGDWLYWGSDNTVAQSFCPPVRSSWPEDIPPYIPVFLDGWQPPAPAPPPYQNHSSEQFKRSNSQRVPPGRLEQEQVKHGHNTVGCHDHTRLPLPRMILNQLTHFTGTCLVWHCCFLWFFQPARDEPWNSQPPR